MSELGLHEYFVRSIDEHGSNIAILEADGSAITYSELERISGRVRDRLLANGIRTGDRVGIYLGKSIDAVATILGVMRAGAAYVPVDPNAPARRNAYIFANCEVHSVFAEDRHSTDLRNELSDLGFDCKLFFLSGVGGSIQLASLLDTLQSEKPADRFSDIIVSSESTAYILYTSGSTGKPKGVVLSHDNATSFVDWCVTTFNPTPEDRFSSHAPFHFDLSILDLYAALASGASIMLIPESIGKEPESLAELISDSKITIWYSAPSILSMLSQFGKLETRDYSSLRTVVFAGEVFPIVHLKSISRQWPHARYFNLYGPTETNVCTYYEVTLPIPDDRTTPYPIGRTCNHLKGIVVGPDGQSVVSGKEGELCILGANVMQGYWDLPEQSQNAFLDGYYKTGDLVIEDQDGNFIFVGRRDRMVKKRGFRVELGEIETSLYAHPDVKEAAVVALQHPESGVTICAHLSIRVEKLSQIALRKFCSERLPKYMIPDRFTFHASLPNTSTDKIDYQRLITSE